MQAKNMQEWHKLVCERDKYVCQVCEKDFSFDCYFLEDGRNAHVCGHHRKTKKAFPELKLNVEIGVCLCFHCHEKIHRGQVKLKEND